MILVSNKPIDSLPLDDPRRKWYVEETNKIKRLKEAVIIKKITSFRLDATGKRHKPPVQGIQSKQQFVSDWGDEVWACANSYKENVDKTFSFTPNFYFLESLITLNPKTQFEIIFFFTCIVNLAKYGYTIDNPEEEARELNAKDLPELEVKLAIYKSIENLDELRSIAKSWGLTSADTMQDQQLKLRLFEIVKKSEQNRVNTKRGYKEFIDEVFKSNPEMSEARTTVNMAVDKGILTVDHSTRRVKYADTQDTICIVPLDEKDRINDFVSETLLKSRNSEMYETIKLDVAGPNSVEKPSIADIDGIKTRDGLKRAAKKLSIVVTPTMKDETIRTKLINAIQGEPVNLSQKVEA